MKNINFFFIISIIVFISCSENKPYKNESRWYTQAQTELGQKIFQTNCSECHGNQAQGTSNWRKPLADGSYPPPPLNGSAHTWHHPMIFLKNTIKQGGIPYGGKMPAFESQLTDQEIEDVIAYIQSYWNDEVYKIWFNKVNKQGL